VKNEKGAPALIRVNTVSVKQTAFRLRAVSFFSEGCDLRAASGEAARSAGAEEKEKERDCGGILIFSICRL